MLCGDILREGFESVVNGMDRIPSDMVDLAVTLGIQGPLALAQEGQATGRGQETTTPDKGWKEQNVARVRFPKVHNRSLRQVVSAQGSPGIPKLSIFPRASVASTADAFLFAITTSSLVFYRFQLLPLALCIFCSVQWRRGLLFFFSL